MAKNVTGLRVGSEFFRVGRAGKVLFDDPGITKLELAAYYRDVSTVMLPHVRGRPLALQRFPDGVSGEGFFQKQLPTEAGERLDGVDVPRARGDTITMARCENAASLYLADQAVVTIHPWLTAADDLRLPDRMVFDLDPPGDDFALVRRTALVRAARGGAVLGASPARCARGHAGDLGRGRGASAVRAAVGAQGHRQATGRRRRPVARHAPSRTRARPRA